MFDPNKIQINQVHNHSVQLKIYYLELNQYLFIMKKQNIYFNKIYFFQTNTLITGFLSFKEIPISFNKIFVWSLKELTSLVQHIFFSLCTFGNPQISKLCWVVLDLCRIVPKGNFRNLKNRPANWRKWFFVPAPPLSDFWSFESCAGLC